MDTLKFAIGDGDKLDILIIKNILQSRGYIIACEEVDGPALLRKIRSINPDFVIVSYNMPGMKGIEIARIVESDNICPALLIADSSQDALIKGMGSENFAYLIKPISEIQLLGTIEYVYNNFKRMSDLQKEVDKLKDMLETRKIVERAKGILIDKHDMKEKDAFRYLQKRSMDECKPVLEIAKRIIEKYGQK